MNESTEDDSALIGKIMDGITSRPDFDIHTASDAEKVVVAVVTAQGIIDNGGFAYFFERDFDGLPDFQLFVEAYRVIGAAESAGAIMEALAFFPNSKPPGDLDIRERFINEHFQSDPKLYGDRPCRINEIEAKILGRQENYTLVGRYIRAHPGEFTL